MTSKDTVVLLSFCEYEVIHDEKNEKDERIEYTTKVVQVPEIPYKSLYSSVCVEGAP